MQKKVEAEKEKREGGHGGEEDGRRAAEHVKGDLKGKRRRWPLKKKKGRNMANRSQPPFVSWVLNCSRAR